MPKSHDGLVSLWLSRRLLESAQLDAYLEEEFDDNLGPKFRYQPAKASVRSAKSLFESDFSLWYDHDFSECMFQKQLVDVRKLLQPCCCSDSFLDAAVQAAQGVRLRQSNAAFLIYDFGYAQPGAKGQESASRHSQMFNQRAPLRFVGSFDYHRTFAKPPPEASRAVRQGRAFMMRFTRLRGYNDIREMWCVERKDERLVLYKNKGRGRTVRRTEECYQDAKHARQAMARLITERLEAGFFITDGWFTDRGFTLAQNSRQKTKKK